VKKLVLAALTVCLFILSIVSCNTDEPTEPVNNVVTIVDTLDREVTVTAPVERIVSITSGVSEIICAFGAVDKIVGRDSYSKFPSAMLAIPEVAGSSYDPNLELVLEQKPEVVIGDTMLQEPLIEQLEAQGIAVIVDSPSDPDRLMRIITNIGLLLDEEERAEEIIGYINGIRDMLSERISALREEEIPTVFYEWYLPYYSAAAGSVVQERIVQAGGYNIAVGEPKEYPQLSAEWVMERNPEIILSQPITSESFVFTTEYLKQTQTEIMSRPELANVPAVKTGRVYVLTYEISSGMRFPIGILFMAKWFHPDLFVDIDPNTVYQELVEEFFGSNEWEELQTMVFAYP